MDKDLKRLVEVLKKRSAVVFAYLFGSRAKGWANETSDWDVAICFREDGGRWTPFEVEAELSRAVRATVQVTVLNASLPPVLGFQIVKDGVLLVNRDEMLRMDFENRVLRSYYDWQYFLKRQMNAERVSLS